MRRTCFGFLRIGALLAVFLVGSATAVAQIGLEDFDRAIDPLPLAAEARILAAIDLGLHQPGFPADDLLALIERLVPIAAPPEGKEAILLMLTRALEQGLSIEALLPAGFELADALEEGLPIEAVVLEALKGIAQGSPTSVIVAGITQRLTLLREVRDLLFSREILRSSSDSSGSAPTTLPTANFDELVVQIADAVSDYLGGGGSPFDGASLYELVADRLHRLPEEIVRPVDVDLVLDRIGPPDLTRIALNALS